VVMVAVSPTILLDTRVERVDWAVLPLGDIKIGFSSSEINIPVANGGYYGDDSYTGPVYATTASGTVNCVVIDVGGS